MLRCILDTSVCVDLDQGGLLEIALNLPCRLEIPDVIADECKNPPGTLLMELGYQPITLPGSAISMITSLREKYPKPSTNDLFALAAVLHHAAVSHRDCILLTGDLNLRLAAQTEGARVHGILWVLDEMLKEVLLSPADAATSLQKIRDAGSWLPHEECEERIKRWK